MSEPFIVGIRFRQVNKVYHFDASAFRDLTVGDFVIVQTARGKQVGEIIQTFETPPALPPEGEWKSIEGKATPRDLVLRQIYQQKEEEATKVCCCKAREMGIKDAKIINSEFSFDGYRLTFLYSCEVEPKPNMEGLRSEMQSLFPGIKIEMRTIGPRDVAKFLGGMGSCGMENRCCARFLTNFAPISVRMAKAQQISLTTMEITGMCGRLRCCMDYEYNNYEERRKELPKRGKRVFTPRGEGRVVTVYPLKGTALVGLIDGSYREFEGPEITVWTETEAERRASMSPPEREIRPPSKKSVQPEIPKPKPVVNPTETKVEAEKPQKKKQKGGRNRFRRGKNNPQAKGSNKGEKKSTNNTPQ